MKNINLKKVLENYDEYEDWARRQLQEIISTNSIDIAERKRILREIILEDGFGQDVVEQEILDKLSNKRMIKWLLDRLFVADIEDIAIDKFVKKVKNSELDIGKFLNIHKKQPMRNYWQLILCNY